MTDKALAARLREHANLHREHLPQDDEQQQWTADLDRAADLIEQMAQRVPLDDASIHRMWFESDFRGNGGQRDWFMEGCCAAERHHGIRSEK